MPGSWGPWTWEPLVLVGIGAIACWYAVGLRRIWHRAGVGRTVSRSQAWCFAAGVLVTGLALVSPIDALGEALFSAHMTQHLILVLIAAPLLVHGDPVLPFVWATPATVRRRAAKWWAAGPACRVALAAITLPSVVWVAHAMTLGFWHIPAFYEWALQDERVHAIEHGSFLLTACLFWWVVFQPIGRRRLGYGAAVIYVSALATLMGGFAAVLTFARAPWYIGHASLTAAWGLTPLEDQQLAGLIMWIPSSVVYLVAVLFCFARWLETDDRAIRRQAIDRGVPSQEPSYRCRPRPPNGLLAVVLLWLVVGCGHGGRRSVQAVMGGDVGRGVQAIGTYGCGSCHVIPGADGATGTAGPPLQSFARRTLIAGDVANTPDHLVAWIMTPQATKPGTVMPNLGVRPADARDIAAYLYTLR